MQIVIITGSPHKNGTSALLADRFIEGAQESGHTVFRFDAAFETVSPCLGCSRCSMIGNPPCVHADSMEKLNPELLQADCIVFVTPLYYFGMSAQLKTVIDRFNAYNSRIQGAGKKAYLLATAYDSNDWTMRDLESHYNTIVKHLGWHSSGVLLATGVGTRGDIERTDFSQQAYTLGRSV